MLSKGWTQETEDCLVMENEDSDRASLIRDDYSACGQGVLRNQERIVGGKITKVNKYPWMVALRYLGSPFCGGSLISDRVINYS